MSEPLDLGAKRLDKARARYAPTMAGPPSRPKLELPDLPSEPAEGSSG